MIGTQDPRNVSKGAASLLGASAPCWPGAPVLSTHELGPGWMAKWLWRSCIDREPQGENDGTTYPPGRVAWLLREWRKPDNYLQKFLKRVFMYMLSDLKTQYGWSPKPPSQNCNQVSCVSNSLPALQKYLQKILALPFFDNSWVSCACSLNDNLCWWSIMMGILHINLILGKLWNILFIMIFS